MAKNGKNIELDSYVSEKTLRNILRNQRVADAAVHKAQEENRRLGIPNWYSIGGKIVSDIQLADEEPAKK